MRIILSLGLASILVRTLIAFYWNVSGIFSRKVFIKHQGNRFICFVESLFDIASLITVAYYVAQFANFYANLSINIK